jgi:hypothetical protein
MRRVCRSSLLAASLFLGVPAALVGAPANTVFAQSSAQVTSTASSDEVEVGEPFTVDLKALSEDQGSISSPDLRAPSGFSVSGPIISTQTYMQFGSGGRRSMSGIGASWTLVPSAPGSFTIPAPSVMVNGQRVKATPMSIKVVPQGTRPQRQQGGFLFPGGPPKGLLGPSWPFSGIDPWGGGADVDEPGDDSSLALPAARSDDVFFHAVADKKTAVIGEQVTVSVYLYYDPMRISGNVKDAKSMPAQDFLRYSLMHPDEMPSRVARAGHRRFRVQLVERTALFPLRAGTLHTGTFQETFMTPDNRRSLPRASEDLTITVTEPPIANRPVGYRIGDVGQFQISALVQPRRVDEGGSVAVSVKVTGSGNFPTSLRMPEKTGIEWLDPEKKELIEGKNGEMTGYRSFGYVVRLLKTGTVDLGTIELPYWNPRAKRYEVARSALGSIEVAPSQTAPVPSAAPSASATGEDPFAKTPPPRTKLSSFARPTEGPLLEGPRFAFALAAPPLLALAGIGGVELARRARARLASRRTSPATLASAALSDAKRAKSARDERAAAAAVERAIVLAIEAATGLKARGLMKDGLAGALVSAGVPESVAQRAQEALGACDKARFDPLAAAEVRVEDAEALVRDLLKAKGP